MNGVDDYLRSFGMSGMLLQEEIKSIEAKFGFELDRIADRPPDGPGEYYPQFEKAVRTEASAMASHYELFYCLETSIRKLIAETLEDSKGPDWWESGCIPIGIVENVEANIRREEESAVTRRSDARIDYTTFGELSTIITHNWDLFGTVLANQKAVTKVMSSLNTLRGPIAHCCPLADDEVARLRLAVKDWFRMIG